MSIGEAKQIAMWEEVLRLCNLNNKETAVVLSRPESRPENVSAAYNAAVQIGANVIHMMPHLGRSPLIENKTAMEAMRSADMVIDLIGLHLLRHGERPGVLYRRDPHSLRHRAARHPRPHDALARRQEASPGGRQVARRAKTMRIESDAGTDLRVELGEYPVLHEYGYSDEPGHWDHWPAGFIATWPNETSSQGTVVIDRGDIISRSSPMCRRPSGSPSRAATSRRISGDLDAQYMRDYMEQYEDPEGYAVSHLGWGLQPKAQWTALGLYDKRQTTATTGAPFTATSCSPPGPTTMPAGRATRSCHLDIPMRHCSVYVDNKQMVKKGEIVPKSQRAVGR